MAIEISQTQKLFNLAEAREHLTLVQAITQRHQQELAPIQSRLDLMLSNDPRRIIHEVDYEQVVSCWRTKIEHLGAVAQDLWIVEFDVGDAFLNWRYPELVLNYVRVKGQSMVSRTKIATYIEQNDPDWA